jgi:hypothetical protein
MAFNTLGLGSIITLENDDLTDEQLTLSDDAQALVKEALLHSSEIRTFVKESISPEDFLVSLPNPDPWLLSQKRLHAVRAKHEEQKRLSETEALEREHQEYFIKGLLGP